MIWGKRADDGLQNPAKKRPIKVVHPAKKKKFRRSLLNKACDVNSKMPMLAGKGRVEL